MTLFNDWLMKESVETDYPMLFAGQNKDFLGKEVPPAYQERTIGLLRKSIADLMSGIEAGKIANPVFKDAKDRLNRCLESAFKEITHKILALKGEGGPDSIPPELLEIYYLHPEMHTINSCIKKLEKIKSNHPLLQETKAFFSEVKPLSDMIEKLKPMVFKKQPKQDDPNDPASPNFIPPRAAAADIQKITSLLTSITQSIYQQQIVGLKNSYHATWNHFFEEYKKLPVDKNGKRPTPTMLKDNPYAQQIISALTYKPEGTYGSFEITLRPDADQVMTKMAEQAAKAMQDAFVRKNTAKLAPIVTAKPGLADAKVISAQSDGGSITGEMSLVFNDNSKFFVRNQVVSSYSKYGTYFYRFPTTFHDVYLADGSRMPQPSEERMHSVFAKIEAPKPEEEQKESFETWVNRKESRGRKFID